MNEKPNTKTKDLKPRLVLLEGKTHSVLGGPPATFGMKSGHVALQKGESCGRHSTKEREEVLVILKGRGIVELEGHENLNLRTGTVAYIPPQTWHNVRNDFEEVLNYVYIVAPVGAFSST